MELNEIIKDLGKRPSLGQYDYYSELTPGKGRYINGPNGNIISEAGLSRLLDFATEQDKDFVTMSAYRKKDKHEKILSKKENIIRNRKLRGIFNALKMGVYLLVGHWRECTISNVKYEDCPKDKFVDVIERSFMIIRPNDMSFDNFYEIVREAMTIEDETQDAIILHISGETAQNNKYGFKNEYYEVRQNGEYRKIGEELTLGKMAQAYSQHVLKMNTPFVFEGIETPNGNSGCMAMTGENIKYFLTT